MDENEGRMWERKKTHGRTRGGTKRIRERNLVLLTCCVSLGQLRKEVCFKMSRAPPVWVSACHSQPLYQALSWTLSLLLSSLTSAPQLAPSRALIKAPGNTDIPQISGEDSKVTMLNVRLPGPLTKQHTDAERIFVLSGGINWHILSNWCIHKLYLNRRILIGKVSKKKVNSLCDFHKTQLCVIAGLCKHFLGPREEL